MGLAMSYLRVPPVLEGEPDPTRIARRVFGERDWRRRVPIAPLDIGGTWQALHYLVTGDPWEGRQPEADVVCGGRLLTEDGADELGMDVIYQVKVFGAFRYPNETLVIAIVLAFVPYLLLRGPVARLATWWRRRHGQS